MRITWFGHAAFLFETQGLRVIIDPYRSPDSGGYGPIDEPADLVVVSHLNDRYHSHLGQIKTPFEVVDGLAIPIEGRVYRGLKIETVRVHESPAFLAGDEVTVVHFRSEGLHVAFLGDLGHRLSYRQLQPIRGADVVLVPAGGPPTIGFDEMPRLLDDIDAKLVVPMHYKTPKINLNIQPVERFLGLFPGTPVDRPGSTSVEVSRDTLPASRRIVVLDHAR